MRISTSKRRVARTFATSAIVLASVVTLVAGVATTASASPSVPDRPKVRAAHPVDVRVASAGQTPGSSQSERASGANAAALLGRPVQWPAAGTARTSDAETAKARQADTATLAVGAVQLRVPATNASSMRVFGHAQTTKAGIDGALVEVKPLAPAADQRDSTLTVDYSGFATGYGADWAGRLQALAFPACFLTSRNKPSCQVATPLVMDNDTKSSTATVSVPSAKLAEGGFVALAAASASTDGTGDFGATSLAQSSSWTAGGSSGGFSWTYPMRVPPSNNGPSPMTDLVYSSQTVDGRTPYTNNQSSIVGEGFDLSSSYVQRSYATCNDDGSPDAKTDLCWANDNATLTLNGVTNELVKAADGTWRLSNDDGSRIRRLNGTTANNGDNDKEYWELTTPDGTKYIFGRSVIPGQAGDPQSVWTVPVVGNNSGEPCYADGTSYATRFCTQAWRWNLDYVVDPRGNAMSYWYVAETNRYQKNGQSSAQYDRGGRLTRIDYGLRGGGDNTTPPMRVVFTNAVRCLADTGCDSYSKAKWPDMPYDQICTDATSCPGKTNPTFFNRFLLSTVTTQILKGGAYTPVDSWDFNYKWLNTGEVQNSTLWLQNIVHSGRVGATTALPSVSFTAVMLDNRVDGASDGLSSLARPRIRTITSETGATTTVNYLETDCGATKPTPASNTSRCFPQKWTPLGATAPRTDWFTKYVVSDVSVTDGTGMAEPQHTYYDYVGGGAWAYNNDKLVPASYRTWADWRGYEKVVTRTGDLATGIPYQTKQQSTFFRGMDGDRTADGGTKTVKVTDSAGTDLADARALAGYERENIVYTSSNGAEYSGTIYTPWVRSTAGSGDHQANFVRTAQQDTRIAVAGGGVRRGRTVSVYDDTTGVVTRVSDHGDLSVDDDQTCTATQYADVNQPAGAWFAGYSAVIAKSKGLCGTDALTPGESSVLSIERRRYDGLGQGQAPTDGLLTETDRLKSYSNGQPVFQVTATNVYNDPYGRMTKTTVPSATGTRSTTVAYTMSSDGTLVKAVTTEDAGGKSLATTKTLAPEWGSPTQVQDPNGKTTTAKYDAFGRLLSVWRPNRATTATASTTYSYTISKTAASSVTTNSLNTDGSGYITSVELFDSLLRPRQSHTPSPVGGWIVDSTTYNTWGSVKSAAKDVYCNASSGCSDSNFTSLYTFSNGVVPALTEYTYDGLGRETKQTFTQPEEGTPGNVRSWSTTTDYVGSDKTTVTPPDGGAATTTLTDISGRATSRTELGTPNLVTDYKYDLSNQLTKMTGPAGTWTYEYDLRGRMTASTDPDAGPATFSYTENDLLRTSTDGRGKSLTRVYDSLDRQTQLYDGASEAGQLLTAWSYDTPAKGMLGSTTRYLGSGGDKVESKVTAYNALYNPTDTTVTLTPGTGSDLFNGLPKTLTWSKTYNLDQTVQTDYLPAVANSQGQTVLPGEAVSYRYNHLGMPTTMNGRTGIVQNTVYDELGAVTQATLGTGTANQIYVTNTYDDGSRRLDRTLVTTNVSAAVISDHRYTYDAAGNTTKDANTAVNDTQCFRYDDHQRLKEAWTPTSGDCATNPSQSLIGGPAAYWQSWTFTSTGQRKTQTTVSPTVTVTDTYSYPSIGQPHPNAPTQVDRSGAGSSTYAYDEAGNTKARTSTPGATDSQQLTWNAEEKLDSLTKSGSTTAYYYGADGEQLLVDSPSGKTLYLGDLEVTLEKSSGAVTAQRFYATPVNATAVRSSDTRIDFILSDPHGSGDVALNGAGLTPTRRYLTPFGESRPAGSGGPATWPSTRGFLDKTMDASTGLTSVGARQYDPALGLFISVDPILDITNPKQAMGYAYANFNPITFTDPSGLLTTIDMGGGGGGSAAPMDHHQQTPVTSMLYGGTSTYSYSNCSGYTSQYVPPPPGTYDEFPTMTWKDVIRKTGENLTSPSWYAENRHTIMEVSGFVPVIGDFVDGIDAVTYVFEGDFRNAAYSGIAVVPVFGSPVKLGLKHGDEVADGATSLLKKSDDAAKAGSTGADDVLNGVRLNAQLTGREIAGGHAFEKHILDKGEFPGIRTRAQFASHIEGVVANGEMRTLSNGRTAFWRDGTVVIRNPRAADGGTAFQPNHGYDYFLKELR